MLEPGIKIEMTKGYRGAKGIILGVTESGFEFYIVKLENGIKLVAGPAAFEAIDDFSDPELSIKE